MQVLLRREHRQSDTGRIGKIAQNERNMNLLCWVFDRKMTGPVVFDNWQLGLVREDVLHYRLPARESVGICGGAAPGLS